MFVLRSIGNLNWLSCQWYLIADYALLVTYLLWWFEQLKKSLFLWLVSVLEFSKFMSETWKPLSMCLALMIDSGEIIFKTSYNWLTFWLNFNNTKVRSVFTTYIIVLVMPPLSESKDLSLLLYQSRKFY